MVSKSTAAYYAQKIQPEEFAQRIANVQRQLADQGLEVGLAYATEHMPGDVQYLTGYDPHLENAGLLVLQDQVIALGGAEGQKMFEDMASAGSWRNLTLFEIPFQDYGDTRFWTIAEIFEDTLGHIPQEIGLLSAANVLSSEIVDLVRQAAGGSVKLRDVSRILAGARYRKSPAELEMFRISSQIATAAMRAMLDALKPGMRELEVAAHADFVCKQSGAYNYGFDTIVCSGPRINTIIGRATNKIIQPGEVVMLGVSPRYEGYTSAIGRGVVAGGASARQAEFLDHGIQAQLLAEQALVAGRPARNVDLAARNYLGTVGLAQYHAYGVGHGIGLTECLEERTATQVSDYDLPTGMAMMLDVGLFGHPEFYGARHEDPYLINHNGVTEKLTDLPMKVYV
jgi:Xaa-Pro aminopeptidase